MKQNIDVLYIEAANSSSDDPSSLLQLAPTLHFTAVINLNTNCSRR